MSLYMFLLVMSGSNFAVAEEPTKAVETESKENKEKHEVDLSKAVFKPGKGLEFKSKDGDFMLLTRLRAQMRYTLEQDGDEKAHGFQLRRARLLFKGNMFGKHNGYKLELAVSPKDIGLKRADGSISKSPLLDWYFHFSQHRDLTLRMGQYKVPYSKQRVVSSGNLQMVDRAAANGEFNLDRDLGFDLRSKDLLGLGFLRYYAGVYMGEGHSSYSTGDFGMMYLGRVEVFPTGFFKDTSEADLKRSDKAQLSFGAGFAYLQKGKKSKGIIGSSPADGGTTDTLNATADISLRTAGLSLEGAFFWREGTRNPGEELDGAGATIPTDPARNGIGFYGQGGYLLPSADLELTARYGQTKPADGDSGLSEKSEAGIGLSRYMGGHAFKLQGDLFRNWGDEGFSEGANELRVQLQMAY